MKNSDAGSKKDLPVIDISKGEKFDLLFENMAEGVALHRYVRDNSGKVINYIIDDVNSAFQKILKLSKKQVVGKLATEAYSVAEAPFLKEYSGLKPGESIQFDVYFPPLKKYFFISASSWGDDLFATIFFDITERKRIEAELKENNDNLEKMNNLMIGRELKMVELKNRLAKKEKNKTA